MKKKVQQTIRKHHLLEKGMHIVVGLSGGPDSLCLFDVLCSMAREWDLKLYPVHVNHKFRPGAAEEDQEFVEKFCEAAGWPCRTVVCDCTAVARQEGLTPEEAGRKVRYEAFRQTAEDIAVGHLHRDIAAGQPCPDNAAGQLYRGAATCGAEAAQMPTPAQQTPAQSAPVPREKIAIAVAQNAQDQCETILFRLLRGSGPDGLAGIAYKRYDEGGFAVIRPLLDVSREEIETYCSAHGLTPRRDHTNEETVYMRNRIRLELIPYLQEHFNPNLIETVNRLGRAAAADKEYLQGEAENAILQDERGALSVKSLRTMHPAVRMRVYQKAAKEAGLEEGLAAAHLEGIDRIVCGESPSARWNLPDGFAAERVYEQLIIEKDRKETAAGTFRIRILPSESAENRSVAEDPCRLAAKFSLNALKAVYGEDAAGRIILRNRKAGDFMTIATGGGLHRKKLQDLLVDMKVPKSQRDQLQVAAIGSEILWILPGEKDKTGKLGVRGRFSAAYPADSRQNQKTEPIIALEYLFRI